MSFEVQTKVQSRAHIPVTYAPKRPRKHAQEPLVKMNPIGPSRIMPNAYLQEKDTYPYSSALTNNHPQDLRPFPLGSTLPITKRGKHAQTCSRHQPPAYQPNPTHSIFHHLNRTSRPSSSSILLPLHHPSHSKCAAPIAIHLPSPRAATRSLLSIQFGIPAQRLVKD